MKHLDERISDLVDDRLEHDERDRALVHLTVCEHCREAVELERDARNALRSLPDIAPPAKLVATSTGRSCTAFMTATFVLRFVASWTALMVSVSG